MRSTLIYIKFAPHFTMKILLIRQLRFNVKIEIICYNNEFLLVSLFDHVRISFLNFFGKLGREVM